MCYPMAHPSMDWIRSWSLQEGLPLHGCEGGAHPGWQSVDCDKDSGREGEGWRITHWEARVFWMQGGRDQCLICFSCIFHASFICRCFKREFPLVVDMQRIDPIKLEISGRNLGARTTATHWHRISSRSSESELRLCWDTVTWPEKARGVLLYISVKRFW